MHGGDMGVRVVRLKWRRQMCKWGDVGAVEMGETWVESSVQLRCKRAVVEMDVGVWKEDAVKMTMGRREVQLRWLWGCGHGEGRSAIEMNVGRREV